MSGALHTGTARPPMGLLRDGIDPRTTLAYLGTALVLTFTLGNPLQVAALTTAVWLVVVGVLEPAEYRAYLLYGALTAAFVMVLNPIVSRAGTTVVWSGPVLPVIGRFSISAEAMVFGVAMGLRLLAVVGLFALYANLVDPDALYRLVAPYSLGSALVMALSIRLFPASVRDSERIGDAMRSRGAPLDTGTPLARTRARIPVAEALMMTSLDRAMGLAEALESRGHGRPGRTILPQPALSPRDRALLACVAVLALAGAWLAWASRGFAYYPALGDPLDGGGAIGALVLGVLAAAPLGFEWGWSAWLSSRSNA